MFKILGLKENIKNVATLCKPYLTLGLTGIELKNTYHKFLREAQPSIPRNDNASEISYLYKFEDIELLLRVFEEDSVLDDFEQVFDTSNLSGQQISIDRVKEALSQMSEINAEFYHLFNLVINTVFSAPSQLAGGGSTSAAIGCIWVNLRQHWKNQDILEFLVHETTHNLVFIDELCYSHYSDYSQLAKEENFSWSAILNRLRPLDKVFHSIIVSTEVLLFREHHIGHPNHPCLHPTTEVMLEQTQHSINYLREKPHLKNLLSKRGNYLLSLCQEKLHTIENSISSLERV
jgi:hypothetical protein